MIHSFAISLPLSRTNTDHTARQAQANQPPSNAKGQTASHSSRNELLHFTFPQPPTHREVLALLLVHSSRSDHLHYE